MIVFQEEILRDLQKMYPSLSYKSLKKIVNYGVRRTVKFLNRDNEVAIDGALKYKEYDGVFFCEEVFYAEHMDKLTIQRKKDLNRKRVKRFNSKKNG